MIRPILKTPERLAEGQVADDVERGEVEPLLNIHSLLPVLGVLVQLDDEPVDVRLDDGLLRQHALRGEPVSQRAAEAPVVAAAGADDVVPVEEGVQTGIFGAGLECAGEPGRRCRHGRRGWRISTIVWDRGWFGGVEEDVVDAVGHMVCGKLRILSDVFNYM